MGNKQRGVYAWKDGYVTFRVVGPCTYAKLARSKRLDSTTVAMRGDWLARITCK
jgi:hypothetical protein